MDVPRRKFILAEISSPTLSPALFLRTRRNNREIVSLDTGGKGGRDGCFVTKGVGGDRRWSHR